MENQTQRPLPNGTAVLVLGIIAIVGCFCDGLPGLVCGIIALVLSSKDLKLYALDPTLYTPSSYSNLKNGRTCAIVGLSLSAIYLIFLIIVFCLWGAAVWTHPQDIFNQHM